jgi:NAD-dependent deacetylase
MAAAESGATVIEINPEPTPLTGSVSDYLIRGPAGPVLSRIVHEIKKIKKDDNPK